MNIMPVHDPKKLEKRTGKWLLVLKNKYVLIILSQIKMCSFCVSSTSLALSLNRKFSCEGTAE